MRVSDLDTFLYSAAHPLTMKCCYFKAGDWEISLIAISFTCKLIYLLTGMSLHKLSKPRFPSRCRSQTEPPPVHLALKWTVSRNSLLSRKSLALSSVSVFPTHCNLVLMKYTFVRYRRVTC